MRIFEERHAPFAYSPVQDYYDVLEDEQALVNDYVVDFQHPEAGDIKAMGHPVRFSKTPAEIKSEAPEFGQHTEEILQELDFDWDKIGALRERGVI